MRKLSTFVLILSLAAMLAACGESEPAPGAPALDAEAIAANNRGVGLMGRFEYAEARTVFAGLVEKWPDWHDARINLAIATLNRQEAGDETAALELARQAMQEDPDNLRARYVAGLVQLYLGEPAEALVHEAGPVIGLRSAEEIARRLEALAAELAAELEAALAALAGWRWVHT